MKPRENLYGVYNFLVDFGEGPVGAFADISGPSMEASVTDVRSEEDAEKRTRKIHGAQKTADVTLKRGLFDQKQLFEWMEKVRSGRAATRTVLIRLMDEARNIVAVWKLKNARPLKYTGPTLSGKGGGDVTIEELVIGYEGIEVEQCRAAT